MVQGRAGWHHAGQGVLAWGRAQQGRAAVGRQGSLQWDRAGQERAGCAGQGMHHMIGAGQGMKGSTGQGAPGQSATGQGAQYDRECRTGHTKSNRRERLTGRSMAIAARPIQMGREKTMAKYKYVPTT